MPFCQYVIIQHQQPPFSLPFIFPSIVEQMPECTTATLIADEKDQIFHWKNTLTCFLCLQIF